VPLERKGGRPHLRSRSRPGSQNELTGGVAVPLIQINMAKGRTDEQKRVLLGEITRAVQTAIDAPLESIRVWIAEFEPTEYMAAGELLADRRAGTT
jgi:4-oxalocrotonate tautomerase